MSFGGLPIYPADRVGAQEGDNATDIFRLTDAAQSCIALHIQLKLRMRRAGGRHIARLKGQDFLESGCGWHN